MPMTQEEIDELIVKKSQHSVGRPSAGMSIGDIMFYRHGFDKTFMFLLDLGYENLFEPWIDEDTPNGYRHDEWWYRCKGCNRQVKRNGRQSHHRWHRDALKSLGGGTNDQ